MLQIKNAFSKNILKMLKMYFERKKLPRFLLQLHTYHLHLPAPTGTPTPTATPTPAPAPTHLPPYTPTHLPISHTNHPLPKGWPPWLAGVNMPPPPRLWHLAARCPPCCWIQHALIGTELAPMSQVGGR